MTKRHAFSRIAAALAAPLLALGLLGLSTAPGLAKILVTVDKPSQTMTVKVNGQTRYRWPVSTGATGFSTPTGSYNAFRLEEMHYSQEWDNAGMPHSVFFTTRGHAIHGSNHPGLGSPRSHGCVRLSLTNAETLFRLVEAHGVTQTKVVVQGADPAGVHAVSKPPETRTRSTRNRPFKRLFGGFGRSR